MSTSLNFGKSVTLDQAAQLIMSCPELRFHLEGEPGIGKSSILRTIADKLGYDYAYVDVPTLDLGDIAMPVVNREKGITEYFPNAHFKLHMKKPLVIMLDEITKGAPPVINMLHPMLEKMNPRLGDIYLDANTIVFSTGNLTTDGVGDTLKAHTRNRIVTLRIQKPAADQWLAWAIAKGLNPAVIAWVAKDKSLLDSYLDAPHNELIFNPKRPNQACVSPRSLETAATIVDRKDAVDRDVLIAALSGAMGEGAARHLAAFVEFADQLPEWASIVAHPETTPVPTSPGARTVSAYSAINSVDKTTINAWMKYLSRFPEEWQATFCINIAKHPTKQAVAFSSRAFAEWVAKNQDLL